MPLSSASPSFNGVRPRLLRRNRGLTPVFLAAIRGYQLLIGPLLAGTGACRFVPSCSEYAAGCVHNHGAGRGSWLALKRVLRCHPFGGHGLDPVP